MKNIKILAPIVALVMGITAVFAFTPQEKSALITADYIVQPEEQQFVPLMATPNLENCDPNPGKHCVYDVTSSGKANIVDQAEYSSTEIDNFLNEGWIQANSLSSEGLYLE